MHNHHQKTDPRQLRWGSLRLAVTTAAVMLAVAGCSASESDSVSGSGSELASESGTGTAEADQPLPVIEVTSEALADGRFDPEHTCDGDNVRPDLSWSGLPEGTAAVAVVLDDVDYNDFVHTAIVNLPPDLPGLTAGAPLPAGAVETSNLEPYDAFLGPCPLEEHEYRFRVFALPSEVVAEEFSSATSLTNDVLDAAIAVGELRARYARTG